MTSRTCIIEPLESRRLLTAALTGITPTPSPVERGLRLTLTATGPTSDTKSVRFFIDTDGDGVLDSTDKRVGSDATPGNGFSVRLNTKKFLLGDIRFFAEPHERGGAARTPVSTIVTVTDAPPTIKAVVGAPKKLRPGKNLTFIATRVKDTDGKVGSVSFFIDSNDNGAIDLGTDTFLGTDPDPKGGFKFKPDTLALPVGTLTILAQATDNDGGTSNVASGTVLIQT
jgi:hypothetical protein